MVRVASPTVSQNIVWARRRGISSKTIVFLKMIASLPGLNKYLHFNINYTGQQEKYTLYQTRQTVSFCVADSESGIHFFQSCQNFAVLPD